MPQNNNPGKFETSCRASHPVRVPLVYVVCDISICRNVNTTDYEIIMKKRILNAAISGLRIDPHDKRCPTTKDPCH